MSDAGSASEALDLARTKLSASTAADETTLSRPASIYNTRIRELPSSERPRERLRDFGSDSLSNSELLAIILRTGSSKQSVLNLASSLLARHNDLGGLAKLTFAELVQERGLGEAKAAELRATFELAIRLNALQPESRPFVRSPLDVMNLVGGEMTLLDQEHLRVVLVNTRNQLMGTTEVYKGNVSSALVRSSELFREAIRQNAPSLILVHNHPSGDPSPSPDDVALTKKAIEAGKLLDIDVMDHIVIGDRRYASLKQLGLV
jgi:DNA repair protein RadC